MQQRTRYVKLCRIWMSSPVPWTDHKGSCSKPSNTCFLVLTLRTVWQSGFTSSLQTPKITVVLTKPEKKHVVFHNFFFQTIFLSFLILCPSKLTLRKRLLKDPHTVQLTCVPSWIWWPPPLNGRSSNGYANSPKWRHQGSRPTLGQGKGNLPKGNIVGSGWQHNIGAKSQHSQSWYDEPCGGSEDIIPSSLHKSHTGCHSAPERQPFWCLAVTRLPHHPAARTLSSTLKIPTQDHSLDSDLHKSRICHCVTCCYIPKMINSGAVWGSEGARACCGHAWLCSSGTNNPEDLYKLLWYSSTSPTHVTSETLPAFRPRPPVCLSRLGATEADNEESFWNLWSFKVLYSSVFSFKHVVLAYYFLVYFLMCSSTLFCLNSQLYQGVLFKDYQIIFT